MRKTQLLLAMLFVSIASYAQWQKPMPVRSLVQADAEMYLFNEGYEGFLVGANDWGTRASLDRHKGYRVKMQVYPGYEDAYVITDYAETKSEWRFMDYQGWESIWIDREMSNTENSRVVKLYSGPDNTYEIGFSNGNNDFAKADYNEVKPTEENYPDARLCQAPKKNSNMLYFAYAENAELYAEDGMAGVNKTWSFVLPADYEAYLTAKAQYEAAMLLKGDIEKAQAQYPSVDITSVLAIYNNTSSTKEQLTEARNTLRSLLLNSATTTNPLDMSALIVNANYDNNATEGWAGTGAGVSYGVAEIYSWDANKFDYHQSISGLENGIYRVGVTGFYRSGSNAADCKHQQDLQNGEEAPQNAMLYVATTAQRATTQPLPLQHSGAQASAPAGADNTYHGDLGYVPNDMNAADIYFKAGLYEHTTILCYVNDGKLTLGLKKDASELDNWCIWDNWTLEYLGTGIDAFQALAQECLARETDYQELAEAEKIYYQHSIYDTYIAAKTSLQNATTAETIAAALPAYDSASKEMAASVDAYMAYYEKYGVADQWVREQMTASNEYTDLLTSYLYDEIAEGFNGNGSASYILNNGVLNGTQIAIEQTYLNQVLKDAMTNSLLDGDDCTGLLVNPNFTEEGGWTSAVGPTWPTANVPVGSATNMVFNVSQKVENLQNGVYEFSTYDLFRAANAGEVTGEEQGLKAYIFMNDYQKAMNGLYAKNGVSEEQIAEDDFVNSAGYVPNSPNGFNAYVNAGRYAQSMFGLVTDGTLTLGYRNDLRYADGCQTWWGPARLIFRGKNVDALTEMLSETLPEANTIVEQTFCGQKELDALTEAIEKAQDAESADELYQGLIDLKASLNAVKEGEVIYQGLQVALTQLDQAILNASENADEMTLKAASAALKEADDTYQDQGYNNEEAQALIETLNAYTVAIKLGKTVASEENPLDVSNLIVNNNFDPAEGDKNEGRINGWTTTPMNGYKQYSASYNRTAFELNQTLSGLPKGKYKVTVHTYYRAGYWNDEEAHIAAGEDTHLTTLYAETSADKFTTKVMNLTEGATDVKPEGVTGNCYTLSNGKFAPDGTTPTVEYFALGYYLNELVFTVPEDGAVTIGLSKTETFANDYEVVGEWNLYYMGDPESKPSTEKQDMTSLIVNYNFDPAEGDKNEGRINGWTTTPMNGYKQYSASYNRTAFELYQDLSGLPKGKYLVTVNTYYRAGYWNDEEAHIAAGEDTHLTTLYAETGVDKFTTKVMNLTEGATDEKPEGVTGNCYTLSNGKFAPDGTTPTVEYFALGYYLNELEFEVGDDGKARIGLSKKEVFANDYEVVGEWHLYYLPETEEPSLEETDVTSLIVNNNFDPAEGDKNEGRINGWTTTPMNGYKQYSASYNRTAFELYQDLTGLPEGTYKVTVHTYYRAGYWNDEEAHMAAGEDTHLTTLYANTTENKYSTKVMNLTEGATDEKPEGVTGNCYTLSNGKFAPDGTTPTVEYFALGYYLNELYFYVSDGKVRIGLSKTETFANDYEVVGAWNLYYYGEGNHIDELTDGIQDIEISESVEAQAIPVAFYNLNGVRLNTPQRGVNIIRMSDGSVRKIMLQ